MLLIGRLRRLKKTLALFYTHKGKLDASEGGGGYMPLVTSKAFFLCYRRCLKLVEMYLRKIRLSEYFKAILHYFWFNGPIYVNNR